MSLRADGPSPSGQGGSTSPPFESAHYRLFAEVPVRFRDTDGMGHVNNAVYLTYLEVARERYWRELFQLQDYRQVDLIVARIEIDFRSPAIAGDTLIVAIRASAIGRRSFDFLYEARTARDRATTVVSARSVQVMYDYATSKTKPVSDEVRSTILAFEEPGAVSVR